VTNRGVGPPYQGLRGRPTPSTSTPPSATCRRPSTSRSDSRIIREEKAVAVVWPECPVDLIDGHARVPRQACSGAVDAKRSSAENSRRVAVVQE
jgi:hypothetical protein